MSSGLIQGGLTSLRLFSGNNVLPISGITAASGLTQVGNGFQVGTLGDHTLLVTLQLGANTRNALCQLQLWNATSGATVYSQYLLASGASAVGPDYSVWLPFTVVNAAHVYQLRLQVAGVNRPAFVQLFAPNFQASVQSKFGGQGDPEYRNAIIDGGGAVLVAGNEVVYTLANAYTIRGVRLIGDVAGTVGIEFQRSPWATYPGGLVSLTGGAGVVLVAAQTVENLVLAGWTTALQAGDVIRASVMAAPAPVLTTRVTTALDLVRA